MYQTLSQWTEKLARATAFLGGLVLLVIILITCISILGRALVPLQLGLGPIKGIYDVTEFGMAAAIFAFLPWCHLRRAHAAVDLFKATYPPMMNRLLDVLFDLAMLAAAGAGMWRLYLGMLDKYRYGETTLIAQIPLWQGYALSLFGATIFTLVAAFCLLRSLRILLGRGTEETTYV